MDYEAKLSLSHSRQHCEHTNSQNSLSSKTSQGNIEIRMIREKNKSFVIIQGHIVLIFERKVYLKKVGKKKKYRKVIPRVSLF